MAKEEEDKELIKVLKDSEVALDETLNDEDFIFIDEAGSMSEEAFNSLSSSGKDLSSDVVPFSFSCNHRERCVDRDGYDYYVVPNDEYDDLDFEGHVVLINGRERLCSNFKLDDNGHLIIFVSSLSEVCNASKKG